MLESAKLHRHGRKATEMRIRTGDIDRCLVDSVNYFVRFDLIPHVPFPSIKFLLWDPANSDSVCCILLQQITGTEEDERDNFESKYKDTIIPLLGLLIVRRRMAIVQAEKKAYIGKNSGSGHCTSKLLTSTLIFRVHRD